MNIKHKQQVLENPYWSCVADSGNHFRYRYNNLNDAPIDTKVLTLTSDTLNWQRVCEFKQLKELQLYFCDKKQFQALPDFPKVKRMVICKARPDSFACLDRQTDLRELKLIYVSKPTSLEPIGRLTNLRSLALENLRNISDFSHLGNLKQLRYLSIEGTLDWNQKIDGFDFLCRMENLEVLRITTITPQKEGLPLASLIKLKNLKEIFVRGFPTSQHAWFEVNMPHVKGVVNHPYRKFYSVNDGRSWSSHEVKCGDDKKLHDVSYGAYLLGCEVRDPSGRYENITKRCEEYGAFYRKCVEYYKDIKCKG